MPTSPDGTVPRAWGTVLRLALVARPGLAARGLAALLRGKRVRGWNRLCLAASAHPGCYGAWIEATEPAMLPDVGTIDAKLVGAIVLGDGDAAATRASLIASLGAQVAIFGTADPLPADPPRWLLPIAAGDRVSCRLGTVLAQHLPGCAAAIVYWDEDRLVGDHRAEPWIKPDWDPLLFAAQDGLVGSCLVRTDMVPTSPVENWSAFVLARADPAPAPLHLPIVLTHRAKRRAAAARRTVVAPPLTISVIVPTRDRADLLETCLAGLDRTHFPGDREIIVVDNDSREPRTMALLDALRASGRAIVLPCPGPFNFAALANAGVAAARGDMVCLLNNDVEVLSPDWLEQMASLAACESVGAVGARLLYPDGAIQHAGVALGIGGAAGHVDKGAVPVPDAFAPWHDTTRTVSAVTAACMLVRRSKYRTVGGMDDRTFAIDFNDVDLCLRLATRGWNTVYCAEATLIHHESRSRGTKRRGADLERFERELAALRARWGTATIVDPYHSRLFRRQSERCLLAF